MADHVFKVKLLLADYDYPGFYYRQSTQDDKLKCCFEDLRDELMRRYYDIRPNLDVKANYKLQWYYDGDMITISNNDDLTIFMELKGARLVVVRMAGYFSGFPQSSSSLKQTKMKPKENGYLWSNSFMGKSITDPLSLDARVHNKETVAISKPVEQPDKPSSSFVDATISNSVPVVKNDQPKNTEKAALSGDSSRIPDSVSVNASIHVADEQPKNTSAIPNPVSQVTSSIPNLQSADADVFVEYDQSDSTLIIDLDEDDDSFSYIEDAHDQPAEASVIQKIVPQMIPPISNLRTVGAVLNVENDKLNFMENVRNSSSILNSASVSARILGEGDQTKNNSTIQHNDLRTVGAVVNVKNDQPKNTEKATLSGDSAPIPDSISINARILGEDDQTKNVTAIPNAVSQVTSSIPNLRIVDGVLNVGQDQQKNTRTIVNSVVDGENESLAPSTAVRFEPVKNGTTSSSISLHTLSHEEIMAKLENMLQYRSKEPTEPKERPLQPHLQSINFSMPPPRLSTPAPELSTKAPELSTKAPELSTKAPELSIKAPELSTKAPELSTKAPELSTKAPELSTKAPELSTKATGSEIPRFENLESFRRSLQSPSRALHFSLQPPVLPKPIPQLSASTEELPKHPNPRVHAALNIMTSKMKFSNAGGWLERLLEAVDGDIDEALRKLHPKLPLFHTFQ